MAEKENFTEKRSTRRNFLKNSGLTLGGLVLGGAVTSLVVKNNDGTTTTEHEVSHSGGTTTNYNHALMFFTPAEYQTAAAAVERIYPEDENGPGAKELGAAVYIDHQLAGQWGNNVKDYRLGAFYKPAENQGPQTKLLRKDLFRAGLAALDAYSKENYGAVFTGLEPEQQDEVLTAFSEGKVTLYGNTGSGEFFSLLRTMTIEGVYADPMYGGNNEMKGWAMRKYPGSRMQYVNEIQSDEFIELKPEGLSSHMS
ncbi:gluconate 2-dehydrogenase subunit 3 family protein [Lysinibacillus halotolerans]|uniref:Gluconate 2-dehydrogenase subunit 3 family protein n=1 Tax=Lysinibacillus halotolerans TaxID=1368476 RepID=A0A3M8H4X0_9BACI|nr:gluconate 2-dehydrogenase subunit 3 family protein [Lysinibacillus halotolerans]RNC97339.1 gluconate 2-dehydrogenase subunit 3 family protein [Lysinibacillus halotolerans]